MSQVARHWARIALQSGQSRKVGRKKRRNLPWIVVPHAGDALVDYEDFQKGKPPGVTNTRGPDSKAGAVLNRANQRGKSTA